jgi:hypothetical protein
MTPEIKDRTMATQTDRNGFGLAKQCLEHDFEVLICAEDNGIHTAPPDRTARAGGAGRPPETLKARMAGKVTKPGSAKH